MGPLTHNLFIRQDTWHSRWYQHWLRLGGKKPAYKENLCHYVRVLLFWAPARWFFRSRVGRVAPWVVAVPLAILATLAAAIFTRPSTVWYVAWHVGGFLLAITAWALVVGTVMFCKDEYPSEFRSVVKWLTSPLWFIPWLVIMASLWVYHQFQGPLDSLGFWVYRRRYFKVSPLVAGLAVTGLTAGLVAILEYPAKALTAGIFAVLLLGLCAAAVLCMFAFYTTRDWLDDRQDERAISGSTSRNRILDGLKETIRLFATWLRTKKLGSRICPFLEFEKLPEES